MQQMNSNPKDIPLRSRANQRPIQYGTNADVEISDDDRKYRTGPSTSVVRYGGNQAASPARRWGTTEEHERRRINNPGVDKTKRRLLGLGVGVSALVAGGFIGNAKLQAAETDWKYGQVRTAHYDQIVGHHDSSTSPSHFVAMNLKGHVIVMEFPGGDFSQSTIYPVGLVANSDAGAVVTLEFHDTNGDGKLDMIVQISGENVYTCLNDGTKFDLPSTNTNINS